MAVVVDDEGDEERFDTTVAFQLWSDIPGLGLEAGNALSIDIDDEGEVEIAGEAVTSYQLTRVKAGLGGVMASRVMRNWVLDASNDVLDLWDVVGSAHANDLDADDVMGQAGAIKISRSFVPPPLVGEGSKVQPTWLGDFLRAPFVLRPQVQVRMPTFHLNEAEVNTLVDYFQALAEDQQIATALKDLLALQADVKGGAYKGRYAELKARITDLVDTHDAQHFFNVSFTESAIAWKVNPALRRHGPLDEHLDTYYLEKEKQQPGWLSLGRELFDDSNINCASCHVRNGRSPGGEPKDWAPDLARARFRLQPSWIRQWITNPGRLVPDTNMPRLFPLDKQQYQDVLKAHSSEQIEAVKDFLMSGLSAGVEVSPRNTNPGEEVTITSSSLDLDGIKSVTIGDRLVNDGTTQFVRIKGRGGRTTALKIRIPTAVSGDSVWLEATDGRFTARTRIQVTKKK
jgi:mono/diheme cytochrome c family protein